MGCRCHESESNERRGVRLWTVWMALGLLPVAHSFAPSICLGRDNRPICPGAMSGLKLNAKSYTIDRSPAIADLVEHLIETEECEGLEYIDIGFDTNTQLRGLFAKDNFSTGEYLCAVPFVTTLLLGEVFFAEEEKETAQQMSAARIDRATSFLQKFAEDPNYAPYLACVPMSAEDPNFAPTPDYWAPEDIRSLEVPSVVQEHLDRKAEVRAAMADTVPSEIDNDDGDEPTTSQTPITEERLQHASWLVRTRAFTTLKKAITLDGTEGFLQRTVLIPFMDLLNHRPATDANAALEVVETKEYDESFYALVAKRPIAKGEELTICYGTGEETSLELFNKYGFWPPSPSGSNGTTDVDLEIVRDLETEFTTSLEEDEVELAALQPTSRDNATRRTILEFRVKIKSLQQE